jgi:hypothetical protein
MEANMTTLSESIVMQQDWLYELVKTSERVKSANEIATNSTNQTIRARVTTVNNDHIDALTKAIRILTENNIEMARTLISKGYGE